MSSMPSTPETRSTPGEPSAAPPAPERFTVTPWPDAVIDALGHDPRSRYVEAFWLGILGPSTTLLLRHVAVRFEAEPEGFELDAAECAQALGLGTRGGRHSPFQRAVSRCCQFKLGQRPAPDRFAVRRKLPPLTRGQVARLPEPLQRAHHEWQQHQLRPAPPQLLTERARRLALSLLEVGESPESTHRQLLRWRFDESIARAGVEWAVEHHHRRTGQGPPPPPAAA